MARRKADCPKRNYSSKTTADCAMVVHFPSSPVIFFISVSVLPPLCLCPVTPILVSTNENTQKAFSQYLIGVTPLISFVSGRQSCNVNIWYSLQLFCIQSSLHICEQWRNSETKKQQRLETNLSSYDHSDKLNSKSRFIYSRRNPLMVW